jgi:hypothetical protein
MGRPLEGMGPENHKILTTCITEYRIQNRENICSNILMYIKLPIYLFFYMALGLNDFDGGIMILMRANPLRGPYIKRLIFSFLCPEQLTGGKACECPRALSTT